ncbi:MAG: hypothetical protein V7K95_04355 [Nostoc sp.]
MMLVGGVIVVRSLSPPYEYIEGGDFRDTLKYDSLARLVKGGNSCFGNDVNWMSAATPK